MSLDPAKHECTNCGHEPKRDDCICYPCLEDMKKEAREEGYKEGYDKGHTEGYEEGKSRESFSN